MIKYFLLLVLVQFKFAFVLAADRPNILWITSEDNDYGWLGCYGNKQAQTPNLDELAKYGVLFKHAYSNSPVCAVARSTIINGSYAVTQGTQHMRSRHAIAAKYKPYTSYLRENGYYCTNRSKTDFNFSGNDKSVWDDCSGKAHYKNRPEGAPFFSIINLTVSHESSLFEHKIKNSRKRGIIPKTPRIKPSDVELRPYLPDLLEIRNDIAIYHDVITALDTQVGAILDELKKSGLAEDTIIFYYGDHGGITPRGKRYLKDSGTHIPMLVHVPDRWQHLSKYRPGERVEEMVAFVDLAPTLLSLIGLEKPDQMQGRPFLGTKRVAPKDDDLVFLYADRFDEIYGMRRGLVSEKGRWKYIRRFTPQLSAAPYSSYQFGQAAWRSWRQAWQDGKLSDKDKKIWEPNQPVEELFDLKSDPWEVKNLAADPAQAERLKSMRDHLKKKMIETIDTGVIPEPMFAELSPGVPISEYLGKRPDELKSYVDLAFIATERDPKNLELLMSKLNSASPIARYWASQGLLLLGSEASKSEPELSKSLKDTSSAVRISSAHALVIMAKKEIAAEALIAELSKKSNQYAHLYAINTIMQCKLSDKIPDAWIKTALKDKQAKSYVKRLAEQLKNARK